MWRNIRCLLERPGPFQRKIFESSSELLGVLQKHVKILIIGAGGLGCELLKDLALMGFTQLDVIDMDTIEVSNLNRQFLFRPDDVGKPKAEVAARYVMQRIPSCTVAAHCNRIQDFGEDFYRQFDVVVCGLDSVVARRWINAMLASLVTYNEDGSPDHTTVIPLVDGGTEGFKGHVLVVWYGVTGCVECTLDLYPPQVNFPLCTIANTPRLPEHCVEYVRLISWQKENPFGSDVQIDGDSPNHIQWIYEQSLLRAKSYGITGITTRLVQGVVKRIIPAVASTNAIVASACASEVFKLVTVCYDFLNNYMNFSDLDGIYTYAFAVERKVDCMACNNIPKVLNFSSKDTLRDVIEYLKTSMEHQMQSPSITTVANDTNKSLFIDFDDADDMRLNLQKSLKDLELSNGQLIFVSDQTTPRALTFRLRLDQGEMDVE